VTAAGGLAVGAAVALGLFTLGAAGRCHAAAPPASPRVAPLLDKAKAGRAVAAYQKATNDLCDALWVSPDDKPMRPQWDPNSYDVQRSAAPHKGDELAAAKLKGIGLERAEAIPLCEKRDRAARALASGSFVTPGADEVLLEVWDGVAASTTSTVAVMRGDGKTYRLIKHLPIGALGGANHFEARLRLSTQSRRDVLFLCESGGTQGVYPVTCGFFGRGTFADPSPSPDAADADAGRDDEVQLVSTRTCGPTASVEWSKITSRPDRLIIEVDVVEAVRVASGDDGPWDCGKETDRASRRFSVEYRFDGAKFRRLTPIPPEITRALGKS
jgi:hypothetical protein